MTLGFYICRDVFGVFFNDTLSMVLSAIVVGIIAGLRERAVNTKDLESKPAD